jgi:AcrR family transcriptional regulator
VANVKSRRELYAALTRSAVLDAARRLFVTQGFDETSVDDIARLAETSKGAVYHHFPDKQAIFVEVFKASQAEVIQSVAEHAARAGTAWEIFVESATSFVRAYLENADARSLLRQVLSVLGKTKAQSLDEELSLPALRAMLTELDRLGELRPMPIDTAAQMVYYLLCDAATTVATAADPADSASETIHVVLLMLGGLRRGQ